MEQHGKDLAGIHTLSTDYFAEKLLARLGENEIVLLNVRELLTEALTEKEENHPGRGMAPRQLLSHRRTGPHCQKIPAKGLQQGAAAFEKWSVSGPSPRVRHCAGNNLPWRWTG